MSDYAALGVGIARLPHGSGTKALHVGTREAHRLDRSRNLVEIHFFTEDNPAVFQKIDEPFAPGFNPLFVRPSHWEAAGTRGIIIRTYVNPRDPHELYHLRVLSRGERHASNTPFVGVKRVWHDMAHYRGRTVSLTPLLDAYKASGLDPKWIETGRGMALKPISWEILDDWRETVDDETSDEGGPDYDDDDDDDDDDDGDDDEDNAWDGLVHDMGIQDDGAGWMDEEHGLVGIDGEWETDEEDMV